MCLSENNFNLKPAISSSKLNNLFIGRCYQDYNYQPGTIITIQPLLQLVHYCQMSCQNNPSCITFNYNKLTWDCELLSQTTGAATVNPVFTTGPKLCGQSTGNL
jgi:PAN domain